jgi:hypothetical protein
MSKKITLEQIAAAAKSLGVSIPALRAVMQVECKQDGFLSTGEPVILFERHVFYRLCDSKARDAAYKQRSDICNPSAGGYGLISAQHGRLQAACSYDRSAALQSASWGLGQVMGYHWESLGYDSLQAFINAMYRSEAEQLDAMCRFIRVNHLIDELQRKDWAGFARRYNGPAYAQNRYDAKLAHAYKLMGGK